MPNRIPPHVLRARERNREAQMERRMQMRDRLRQARFKRIGFLDRAASMILAAMYSSEHLEISLHIPKDTGGPKPKPLKPKQRVDLRHTAVGEATTAFAARRITNSASVLYSVSSTPEEQVENATEIGFDTVAVAIMDNSLYVARNFKRRQMPNPPGAAAALKPKQQYQYGRIPDRTMANIMAILRPALIDANVGLNFVYFLSPWPPPASEKAAAAPHAEMQLVSYFRGRERGMKVGVSKGLCPRCQEALRSRGVEFVATHIHHVMPHNWLPPDQIQVRVESRHRVTI